MQQNPDQRIQIELFLAARELTNLEFFSKSDPYLEVYYSLAGEKETFLGRTETAECNLDPNWEKSFTIDYYPDLIQMIRFQIFDENRMGREFMGECQGTIKDFLQSKNSLANMQLKRFEKNAGFLYCKAVQFKSPNHFVTWQFQGINLKNTDGIFGKTDPFLKFYLFSDNVWCQVYQTEVIKDNLNPIWREFEVSLQRLCFNDETKKFKVECIDRHEKGKNNQLLGGFETTIDEIFTKNIETFQLIQPKGGSAGTIKISNKKKIFRANFDDYIQQGTIFNIVLGIDYSAKNGNPQFPDSLHSYIENNNKYSKAISDTTSILEKYDSKKLIAIYGIGAEPHLSNYNQNTYQTLFPLTGDFQKPQAIGSEGAIKLYKETLKQIIFKGDCQLEDFIKYLQTIAEHNAGKLIYTIGALLIQNEITDLKIVQDLILAGSRLPYSLILLGIGKNEFKEIKNMIETIKNTKPSIRNNITFCHYKEDSINILKKDMMQDLPQQVVSYKQ